MLFVSCSDDEDVNELPVLDVNAGITLKNGETLLITSSDLSFSDLDAEASEISFTIITAPQNGRLVKTSDPSTDILVFTQQDINENQIQYIHDGGSSLSDSFTFRVSDGVNELSENSFSITIGEKHLKTFYVLNEGSYGGTGSLSSINVIDGVVTNKIFKSANAGVPLGELPQAMAFTDKYILMTVTTGSGAGRLEIINKSTLKHVAYIDNLAYPREVTVVGDIAYVSNGGNTMTKAANEVVVVDLTTLKEVKRIAVGAGPEKMVQSGDLLYVANSGGWSNDDNTVTVINTITNTVENTITVNSCPKDMVVDANGDVWVYCAGKPDYSDYPNVTRADYGISKIEVSAAKVTNFEMSDITAGGIKNMAISKDQKTIYYISDAVYAMDYKATTAPTTKFIDKTFYGIDVNPETNDIFCCETVAGGAGSIVVYNEKAEEIANYEVGVNPNSTFFSY